MKELEINSLIKPKQIGLCFRDGSQYYRYAFIELENKERLVSTIPLHTDEGLTIGEYFEGRVSDYDYCIKHNDKVVLNTEFEIWEDDYHKEDYTGGYGIETIR